ncbi:hypothetical protein SVAN01_03368 [Stagonosporopsis vannaccii]|nr:hypothetical protein SVAN01_03368 [Stagonosporopsis vannaccii]
MTRRTVQALVMNRVEDAVPPPHLFPGKSATWPSSYVSQTYPLSSSPAAKSPQLPQTYDRIHVKPMPSHNINHLPASGWYGPSMTSNEVQQYTGYDHYVPHRSSGVLSPPTLGFSRPATVPSSVAHADLSSGVISPVPIYPQSSLLKEAAQQLVELPQTSKPTSQQSPAHVKVDLNGQKSPHGNFSVVQPVLSTPSWAVDSLGIQTPSVQSDSYYTNFVQQIRVLRPGDTSMQMALTSPQPRRGFTPIAPQPIDAPRSTGMKRPKEEEDRTEISKRRRRSESTTSTPFELTEEDRLLLKLKEEESMPWKDIAARFQEELGKQYQIPALQMRLKRLRERMRVWTETDVRALRMAHEYWAHNKFDIISQKMLEYGAQEKWTSRQCARKWAEGDGQPTPMPQYEQHTQHSFTPYSMSPAEPATSFLPYMPS